MENEDFLKQIGCAALVVFALGVATVGFFFIKSRTELRRVPYGQYGIVIHYSDSGKKDVKVYPGGYQYSVPWGANVTEFDYSAQVQTLKMYQSTSEGIAPYPDDIKCNDVNGVRLSGDVQITFEVAQSDVPLVYSQHQDLELDSAPGTNGVDSTVAGLVVRPIITRGWVHSCTNRTYIEFGHSLDTVAAEVFNYAQPLLKDVGITLLSVSPQQLYLPKDLQDSLNAVATANAQLQASQIAIQTAKNKAQALEEYRQEIAKDPALLKLLMLEDILNRWNGQGQVPQLIANALSG